MDAGQPIRVTWPPPRNAVVAHALNLRAPKPVSAPPRDDDGPIRHQRRQPAIAAAPELQAAEGGSHVDTPQDEAGGSDAENATDLGDAASDDDDDDDDGIDALDL